MRYAQTSRVKGVTYWRIRVYGAVAGFGTRDETSCRPRFQSWAPVAVYRELLQLAASMSISSNQLTPPHNLACSRGVVWRGDLSVPCALVRVFQTESMVERVALCRSLRMDCNSTSEMPSRRNLESRVVRLS